MSTATKKLTTCAPKTAVAYARYSSAGQRDVSIDQQLQDIRAYAAREGYNIVYEYADRAKSGFKKTENRTEFQSMLRAAEGGSFDTVIAWKVDRFGRNRRESAIFKGQLADCGVSVVYAMEPIPDGAAGCLTEGMLEAIAEWYSRNLSENVRRGLYDNAKRGIVNGGKMLGYRKTAEGHYEIDETSAPLVRRIFTLYSQGNSASSIAKMLNEEGIPSPLGVKFRIATITFMIQNESYIGNYHYCNVPISIPPIIDKELWDICQLQRQKRTKKWTKGNVDYLLSGKMKCGLCGATLVGNHCACKGGIYSYYTCGNKKIGGKCRLTTRRKAVYEKKIFDFIFDNLLYGPYKERFVDNVVSTLKTQQEESPVRIQEAELRNISRRIDNLNNAISEGIWMPSTLQLLKDLTKQSEDLQKKVTHQRMTDRQMVSRDRILFYLHKVMDGDRNDPDFLKTITTGFINSITVYDDWLRMVINAADNVGQIPQEELPPLHELPDLSFLGLQQTQPSDFVTVQNYPVIVFKIAI